MHRHVLVGYEMCIRDRYKEATMYNGKLCSVAWMPHPVAMFYNKDLFEKAGLDPEIDVYKRQ